MLAADEYTRWLRLQGHEAIYICGSDEHGTATEQAAKKEGVTPEEHAKKYHDWLKQDYEWFNVDFTNFGRTSSPSNHELTKYFFEKNQENIFEDTIKQQYCNSCQRFLPDRYVKGKCPNCGKEANGDQCEYCGKLLEPQELLEPVCVECGSTPEVKETKHLFFDLPKFEEPLQEWLSTKDFWRPNVINWARSLAKDLKPRCITRDLKWGVSVPKEGYENKVFYVWFDAPIGYLAITKDSPSLSEGKWRDWWTGDTKLVHFLGKDNIPFHTIIFPSMLMGTKEFVLPWEVVGNEYLNYEGKKFSKSKGVGVTLEDVRSLPFPPDYWRYTLTNISPETHDADFTWDDFKKYTDELADVLGNFVHRTFVLTKKYYGLRVPEPGEFGEADKKLIERINSSPEKVSKEFETVHLREALKQAINLVRDANAYLNEQEPWKNEGVRANTLYLCLNVCRSASILLYPFIPESCDKIYSLLNVSDDRSWSQAGELSLNSGRTLNESKPLFEKVENIEEYKDRFSGKKEGKKMIKFDDFEKLDLRVALVKSVEKVEKADKLLKIVLDVGELGERIVAAGLAQYYKPEELLNKKVVYLSNLESRKLRGIESQGMILAAGSDEEGWAVLTPDKDLKPGDPAA